MFKKTIILIVCILFIFQAKVLFSANEQTDRDVVAIVNGEKILRGDLNRRLKILKRINQDTSRSTQMLIVYQLAKKILLEHFIEGQNIEVSDKEVKGEVKKIRVFLKSNPNTSGKTLEDILKSRNSSVSELEDEVRGTLALSKYLDKEVSEAEKRNYFDANKSSFNGEKVRASHILVDTRKIKTEDELKKARQKIESVKKEINNGADFAEMAAKYSDCPSAEKGGDIGFFERRGSVVEPFAKVAFSLGIGEVSEPTRTQFGYHIIKVTDRKEGKEVNYDDVKEMVEFVYMEKKTESLIEDLFKKAKIEIFL